MTKSDKYFVFGSRIVGLVFIIFGKYDIAILLLANAMIHMMVQQRLENK